MSDLLLSRHFENHTKKIFRVQCVPHPLDLELAEVIDRKPAYWPSQFRPPFTLMLKGSRDTMLLDATYTFENSDFGTFTAYMSQIASPSPEYRLYQIVFN